MIDTQQTSNPGKTTRPGKTGIRPNILLNRFVTRFITPVVLLAGLLILAFFNFKGVLDTTTTQDNLFRGEKAYSIGALQSTYEELSGTDRPAISYNGLNVLSYVDWSSTISVDGHVVNLWDNQHGYDYDRKNPNDKQFFATSTGPSWQLVQVVTVVDAHTVTVQYDLVARAVGKAVPHHVELSIVHSHASWYQPTVQNNTTFTAGVLPGYLQNAISAHPPQPAGYVTVSLAGPALADAPITIDNMRGGVGPGGDIQTLADSFTTNYVIDNPQINRLTPLGVETITFSAAQSPIGAPVVSPTPISI
ncbi:MAG TPA: hypothetical protein VJR48_16250 [Ktedonobacterales bacterium]|nr:hypothetical protein [Ktedonobacterales bacterium]